MLKPKTFRDGIPIERIIGTRKVRQIRGLWIATDSVAMMLDADIILARDIRTGESLVVAGADLYERREGGEDVGEHLELAVNLDMRTRDVADLVETIADLRGSCDLELSLDELEQL